METKACKNFFLFVIFFCLSIPTFAQNNYCYNQNGKIIHFSLKRVDSLYFDYVGNDTSVIINIVNPTKDTLYLFKSYFPKELQSSKYLHQLDKKNKAYYISFAPIVSNLSTKQSDRIILGESSIGQKEQVLYDFIKLNPNTYYSFGIEYQELFKNSANSKNVVKYYNKASLSKFKKASFKTLTSRKLTGKYSLVFQFAIYNNVAILCKESNYYLKEFEFDKQSKSFRTIDVPVKINSINFPLFN